MSFRTLTRLRSLPLGPHSHHHHHQPRSFSTFPPDLFYNNHFFNEYNPYNNNNNNAHGNSNNTNNSTSTTNRNLTLPQFPTLNRPQTSPSPTTTNKTNLINLANVKLPPPTKTPSQARADNIKLMEQKKKQMQLEKLIGEVTEFYLSRPKSYYAVITAIIVFGALVLLYYSYGGYRSRVLERLLNEMNMELEKGSAEEKEEKDAENKFSIYHLLLIDYWFQYIDRSLFSNEQLAQKICRDLKNFSDNLLLVESKIIKERQEKQSGNVGSDDKAEKVEKKRKTEFNLLQFLSDQLGEMWTETQHSIANILSPEQVLLNTVWVMIRLKHENFYSEPAKQLIEANLIGVLVDLLVREEKSVERVKERNYVHERARLGRIVTILDQLTRDADLHDQIVNHKETMTAIFDGLLHCENEPVRKGLLQLCNQLIASEVCYPKKCSTYIANRHETRQFLSHLAERQREEEQQQQQQQQQQKKPLKSDGETDDSSAAVNLQAMKVYSLISANKNDRMNMLGLNVFDVKQDNANTVYLSIHFHRGELQQTLLLATYVVMRWAGKYPQLPMRQLKFLYSPLMTFVQYRCLFYPISRDIGRQCMVYQEAEGTRPEDYAASARKFALYYNAVNFVLPAAVYLSIFKQVKYMILPFALIMLEIAEASQAPNP